MDAKTSIRCGDHVLHKPTGEKWLVAFADYERGELAWTGWPQGTARIEDCELIHAATDEEHRKHVGEWLTPTKSSEGCFRAAAVRRLYGEAA